jgi:hypothetical protein
MPGTSEQTKVKIYDTDSLRKAGVYVIADPLFEETEVKKEMDYSSKVQFTLKKNDSIIVYDIVKAEYYSYFLIGQKNSVKKGYVKSSDLFFSATSPVYFLTKDEALRAEVMESSLPFDERVLSSESSDDKNTDGKNVGKRGGVYHINDKGKKVYEKKK